ncbi:MAG TPA: nucleotide exchange factor GrpE [Anaeromyxobacteraceae bacterium]|nr:nucleotide exchange factor GrpE [Anaeromyxobacteraceae bacterium]
MSSETDNRPTDGEFPQSGDGADDTRPDEVSVPIEAADAGPEVRLADAEARLKAAEEQLAQEHDRLLRAAADLDNFRKRAAREREEVQKYGNERLLKDLVPVLDNLDRAIAAAPATDPVVEGVKLVRRTFEDALAKHGITIESALGKRFDPNRDEALAQVPDPAAEPGTVVHEHGRAVFLSGRLIRPAMVAVATSVPAGDGG